VPRAETPISSLKFAPWCNEFRDAPAMR
jgi:hypothetical protein